MAGVEELDDEELDELVEPTCCPNVTLTAATTPATGAVSVAWLSAVWAVVTFT